MEKIKEGIQKRIGYILIPFLLVKNLFFESKYEKEITKWIIKNGEARKMFEDLHSKRISLQAVEVINTLISIHSFHELPYYGQWREEGLDKSLMPYEIFSELSRNQTLTTDDATRLVDMLSWKEIKDPGYSCAWYPIIEVARKFPTESNIEKIHCFGEYLASILKTHFEKNSGYAQVIAQHIKYAENVSLSSTL